MNRYAVLLALAILLLLPASASAADCQFVLGFKTLRDLIGHEIVGECLENEHYEANGDSLQQTTGGLMVWRKADNWTAFTDGYRSWVNGPIGLQQRLNTERFDWEVENIIAAIPHGPRNPTSVQDLLDIAQVSTPVFLALVETAAEEPLTSVRISHVLDLARLDDSGALQLLAMPIVRTQDQYSFVTVLKYATDLARSDPTALNRILSHPELEGGIRDDNVITFELLVFGESFPEAAAAIKSLAWVQDGVTSWRHGNLLGTTEIQNREEEMVSNLVSMTRNSEQAALTLLGKSWIQDSLISAEIQVIGRLSMISDNAPSAALQLVGMPFLDSVDSRDKGIVTPLFELLVINESGLFELLAHPQLSGGITDDHYEFVRDLANSLKEQN